ncbi:MAG TPA: hypothetical protein VN222_18540 [Novosphingobium sp.]|nr:hypothetical protein [Novosphingobium sp.]
MAAGLARMVWGAVDAWQNFPNVGISCPCLAARCGGSARKPGGCGFGTILDNASAGVRCDISEREKQFVRHFSNRADFPLLVNFADMNVINK